MKKQPILKLDSKQLYGFKLDKTSDQVKITSATSAKIGSIKPLAPESKSK